MPHLNFVLYIIHFPCIEYIATDCVGKIYTKCIESGDTSYSSDYFPEPVTCSNGDAVCGCDAFAAAFWDSYIDDTSDSWCQGQFTWSPTVQPTTMIPTTNEPTIMDISSTFALFMTSELLTSQPSTMEPTTNIPTTDIPTTASPTTSVPTEKSVTASPTKVPADIGVDQSAASYISTRKIFVTFFVLFCIYYL